MTCKHHLFVLSQFQSLEVRKQGSAYKNSSMTFIFLYVVLSLCAFNEGICANDSKIGSCGNFMKDWFPNIAPQTSVAPYVLNVS